MVNQIKTLAQKWVILTKRDRLMLFMVGLFGIAGLMDTYLTDPLRQQAGIAQEEVVKLQQDAAKIQLQVAELKSGGSTSINPLQKEINDLKQQTAEQERMLSDLSGMMVSPDDILNVLKKLLVEHKDVRVVSMESLPAVSFVKKHVGNAEEFPQAERNAQSRGVGSIYQHSIRLRLTGSYMALVNYVADLKRLGQMIAWESAELKSKYPDNELVLEVYTLSTQRVWMGI